jgi:hypothetical protein
MEPSCLRTSSAPGELSKWAGGKRCTPSETNIDEEFEMAKVKRTHSQPWNSDPTVVITVELQLIPDYISMIHASGIPKNSSSVVASPSAPGHAERHSVCHGDSLRTPLISVMGAPCPSSPRAAVDMHGSCTAPHPPATRARAMPKPDPSAARGAGTVLPNWGGERRHCGRCASSPAVIIGGSAAAAHDRATARRQRLRWPPRTTADGSRRRAVARPAGGAPGGGGNAAGEGSLEVVTWNLASPNNNPFEFWVRVRERGRGAPRERGRGATATGARTSRVCPRARRPGGAAGATRRAARRGPAARRRAWTPARGAGQARDAARPAPSALPKRFIAVLLYGFMAEPLHGARSRAPCGAHHGWRVARPGGAVGTPAVSARPARGAED